MTPTPPDLLSVVEKMAEKLKIAKRWMDTGTAIDYEHEYLRKKHAKEMEEVLTFYNNWKEKEKK